MVNVSTLHYVLENLEDEEWIDLNEIEELERRYLRSVFSFLDDSGMDVRPSVVQDILKKAKEI
jgi:hypothetical protein